MKCLKCDTTLTMEMERDYALCADCQQELGPGTLEALDAPGNGLVYAMRLGNLEATLSILRINLEHSKDADRMLETLDWSDKWNNMIQAARLYRQGRLRVSASS